MHVHARMWHGMASMVSPMSGFTPCLRFCPDKKKKKQREKEGKSQKKTRLTEMIHLTIIS
jgi:hypothetical protein